MGKDNNEDGIGDTPHVIGRNNQDYYPLMSPWSPTWSPKPPVDKEIEEVPLWAQWWFWAILVAGIIVLAGVVHLVLVEVAHFPKKKNVPTPTAPTH